jgi:Skp family chaperone for outer membrane proteins
MKKLIPLILLVFFSVGLIAQSPTKIGFVDTQYILEQMPAYQNAINQLDNLSAQWQIKCSDRAIFIPIPIGIAKLFKE